LRHAGWADRSHPETGGKRKDQAKSAQIAANSTFPLHSKSPLNG
jgi:hypothetical protein